MNKPILFWSENCNIGLRSFFYCLHNSSIHSFNFHLLAQKSSQVAWVQDKCAEKNIKEIEQIGLFEHLFYNFWQLNLKKSKSEACDNVFGILSATMEVHFFFHFYRKESTNWSSLNSNVSFLYIDLFSLSLSLNYFK